MLLKKSSLAVCLALLFSSELLAHDRIIPGLLIRPSFRINASGYAQNLVTNFEDDLLYSFDRSGVLTTTRISTGKILNQTAPFSSQDGTSTYLRRHSKLKWLVIASSYNREVKIIGVDGKEKISIPLETDGVSSIAVAPSAPLIGIALREQYAPFLFNIDARESIALHPSPAKKIFHTSVEFSPDGKHIASVSVDESGYYWGEGSKYSVGIWDYYGNLLKTQSLHHHTISGLEFSPDGRYLVTTSYDSSLVIWDLLRDKKTLRKLNLPAQTLAISPEGSYFALVSVNSRDGEKRRLQLYDWSGTLIREIYPGRKDDGIAEGDARLLKISKDGQWILSSYTSRAAEVWSRSGELAYAIPQKIGFLLDAAFFQNSTGVFTGSNDGTMQSFRFSDALHMRPSLPGYNCGELLLRLENEVP